MYSNVEFYLKRNIYFSQIWFDVPVASWRLSHDLSLIYIDLLFDQEQSDLISQFIGLFNGCLAMTFFIPITKAILHNYLMDKFRIQ